MTATKSRARTDESRGCFLRGYQYGRAKNYEMSPREIAEVYPECDSASFAQGMLDGLAGDTWRRDRIRQIGRQTPCTHKVI